MTNPPEPTTQTPALDENQGNTVRLRNDKFGGVGLLLVLACYSTASSPDTAPVVLPLLLIVGAVWYKLFDRQEKKASIPAPVQDTITKSSSKGLKRPAILGLLIAFVGVVVLITAGDEVTPPPPQTSLPAVTAPRPDSPNMTALRRDNPREYLNRVKAIEGEARWRAELQLLFPEEYAAENTRLLEEQRENLRTQYVEKLTEAIDDLKDYSLSICENNPDAYIMSVEDFDDYAKTYEQGATLDLKPAQQELREVLRKRLVETQARVFPKLRDYMAQSLHNKLWEDDLKVYAHDNGNRALTVEGWRVAANRVKQELHKKIYEELMHLRFERDVYLSYKGGDGSEWTLEDVPSDRDIAYWQNGRFVVVVKASNQRSAR